MCPMIKSFTAVIKKYHGIDTTVNDQKADEKKARKAHGDLFPYRRSEKMFPGHIQELWVKFGAAKLHHEGQNTI